MAQPTATTEAPPQPAAQKRHDPKVVVALRNFAISISVFNILGYVWFGFEQPWTWPFIALATAYTTEIVFELIGARVEGRAVRFRGNGMKGFLEFIYPAHITALAVNMLTYVNDRVITMIFGVVLAVAAKWILRAPIKGRMRHYMNPSNLGIAAILLLFPWSSIAPPYHFSENLHGPGDWILPGIILTAGTMLNAKLTMREWLIFAWITGFALQAIIRGVLMGTSIPAGLAMMTGVAFILFTNYMISDPGTTPSSPGAQMAFGFGVAAVYGLLTAAHVAYGIFFATALVCLIRGGFHWTLHFIAKNQERKAAAEADAADGEAEARAEAGREAARTKADGDGAGVPAGRKLPTTGDKEVVRA